ncbi:hypothetical protein B566_EDAN018372 [Ephemera danica]|nr:hypothetical protein B566_EDAN018372 [Ephemera danica]
MFSTTKYSIRSAKQLVEQKGILSTPNPRPGKTLPEETSKLVVDFYETDDVSSKLLTGTRDIINGKQKRLLLHNLGELHAMFLEQYSDKNIKIGRTKFAELRPKHCVYADGSAAQYKNKFNYLNLTYHAEEFGVPAEWHHFGTSHGRGVCDAVGGSVKREVMRASLQRIHDGHITSPQALYDFVRQHMPKIKFDFVSIAEFKDEELILNKRYKNAKTIRGTQNIHCIVPVRKGVVLTKVFSNSSVAKEHAIL